MTNDDERDHAEEAANIRLLRDEADELAVGANPSMYYVAVLEGDAIENLLALMRRVDRRSGTYRIQVCIDEGLKIKVDELVWSPPIGRVDPASIPPEPRALFIPHGPEGSGL